MNDKCCFSPIMDPVMVISSTLELIDVKYSQIMDSDLQKYFQRMKTSIDKISDHVKNNQSNSSQK